MKWLTLIMLMFIGMMNLTSCKTDNCKYIKNQLSIKNINSTELNQSIIYKQQDNIVLKNKLLKNKNRDKITKKII